MYVYMYIFMYMYIYSILSRYDRIDIQSLRINPLLVVEVKNLCRARAERGASSL